MADEPDEIEYAVWCEGYDDLTMVAVPPEQTPEAAGAACGYKPACSMGHTVITRVVSPWRPVTADV